LAILGEAKWRLAVRSSVTGYSFGVAFRFGDCELRDELFELLRRGEPVPVEPKVLQLIVYLVRNRSRSATRAELLDAIWSDVKVGNASLTRAVVEARRAIGDETQEMIETVRGYGFRFTAPVAEVALAPSSPYAASATLTGRDAPLAALGAQLETVLSGSSAFTWISGVAGIGKTRLLDELALRARARDVAVHVARCHESLAQPPFRPWTMVLDAIADGGDPDGERVRAASARLSESGSDIATFDAVTRVLVALGRRHPRLLAFDDLHWADEGTLDLLRFVTREAREAGLFVVSTLRETVHVESPTSRALGRLLCEYGGVSLPLRGLSRDETAQLVRVLKQVQPSDAMATAVHERTGGCPLFIHQILETEWARRALEDEVRSIATSIDVKRGLSDSVSRHLDGVSGPCRDTLTWAAVLGKTFAFAPLATVTGLDANALLNRLEEARRGHLVQRAEDGDYRFVHPLVADVVYGELSGSERAARHRAAALALEAHYAASLDIHAGKIARHFVRAAPAGTAREAFDYSARAARHAARNGDLRESARHWARAMRVLDLLPTREPARLDVLLELARAYTRTSDTERARNALLDAAMLARALGHSDALAEAALEFAGLVPPDDAQRRALLAEARSAVERTRGPRAEALTQRLEHASRS
jgi:predicted ATPase